MSLLRRLRPRHLLSLWIGWWIVLVGSWIIPALPAIQRVRSAPKDASHLTIGINGDFITGRALLHDQVLWDSQIGFTAFLLWVSVPPLLLFLAWLAARPHRGSTPRAELTEGDAPANPIRQSDRVSTSRHEP